MKYDKNTIVQVDNLTKTFIQHGWFKKPIKSVAVDHISFDLKAGEILGFLGVNGSGKTTTIQMLLDLLTPTSGSIRYFGKDLAIHRAQIMQQVTYASAYTHLIGSFTVAENMQLFGKLYGLKSADLHTHIKQVLTQFSMWDMRDEYARSLSAGQTTRVVLARAFLPRPAVLLLDEPTASLDFEIAHEVRRFILQQQRDTGVSILFTSHNMDEVAEVCNRVLILQEGTIIADDTPKNLAARISTTHIWLIVSQGIEKIENYAQRKELMYEITGDTVNITIEEKEVPAFLQALSNLDIRYSNISIDKPHLEDYFLQLIRQKSKS